MSKSIPEVSQDVRVLVARMRNIEVGQSMTYTELGDLVSRDLKGRHRYMLASATKILWRDHGIQLGTLRKVGVKRLEPKEIPAIGDQASNHIRGTARRANRRLLAAVESVPMDNATKLRVTAQISVMGAIAHAAGHKQIERVEKTIAAAPKPDVLAIAEVFRSQQ